MTRVRALLSLASIVLLPMQAHAQAGLGPRGFDTDRPDITPLRPTGRTGIPPTAPQVVIPNLPDITIRDVAVVGDSLLDRAALGRAVAPFAGRRLTSAEINAISEAISLAHREAGLALFGVVVPQQDFAQGVVIVQVVEGQVAEVEFEGDTDGADLGLTRAYARALQNERPLRRATLERYLLLMADIPGRRVTSRFETSGSAGRVKLIINVRRTSVRFGLGIDNLGANYLGNAQMTTGATVNSVLREGDSTRLTVGFPIADFNRFTYLALRHQQPIGTDGFTLSGNFSFLEQRVTDGSNLHGQTSTFSLQAAYPIIRAVRETLQLFGSVDYLESRLAVPLGRISDEATRVLRAGVVYGLANEAQTRGGSLAVVLSQGIDTAGARQGIAYYGDPGFTKVTAIASFQQALFEQRLVLRLRANAQFTTERLPASETFTYGGVNFGRGFDAATLYGDRGVAASATLAMPFRTVVDVDSLASGQSAFIGQAIRGSEAYIFVDGARVENFAPAIRPRGDRAASTGIGIGIPAGEETMLNLEVASPMVRPRNSAVDAGTRFVAIFRRNF
ncbi:MAG: Polypeptide-transport-associated domain protein ShlB-type [Rubritepida sp.]|nr:Polypeptide-transport-associated domain protein ShlB-type [Rubritepida sp.]